MPTQVTNRDYFAILKNGTAFTLNTSDVVPNFLGFATEKLRRVTTINVSWSSHASVTNLFTTAAAGANRTITRAIGSFILDDWKPGDTLYFEWGSGTPVAGTATVLFVTDDVLTVDSLPPPSPGSPPRLDNGPVANFDLFGTTELTGFRFDYGLPENTDADTFLSHIDNSFQSWYADGVGLDSGGGRTTSVITCVPVAGAQSWVNGTATAAWISSTANDIIQAFEIVHEFIIAPYYLEGQLLNLQQLNAPDLYVNNESMRYVANFKFSTFLSNPNTERTFVDNQLLGNIGWFNETFNGLNSQYSKNSVVYSNASTVGLTAGGTTHVVIELDSANSTITGTTVALIGVSLLPSQPTYQPALNNLSSDDPFEDIWLYETARQVVGAGAVSGTIITNVLLTDTASDTLTLEADITYTVDQQAKIDAGANYLLWVMLEDDSLAATVSDRAVILIDVQPYQDDPDIPDLMFFTAASGFSRHDATSLLTGLNTNFKGYSEDGFTYYAEFDLETAQSALLQSFTARMVAYKDADDTFFEFDSVDIDLSSGVIVGGVQQFSTSYPRGYQLNPADGMGKVVLVNGNLSGTFQRYRLLIPFKWRWEKWKENADADNQFYDNAEQNNGLNMFTPGYAIPSGYTLRLVFDAKVSGTLPGDTAVSLTDYQFVTDACEILDFETDPFSPDNWSAVITLRDSNGTDIGASYVTNGDTLFECLFTWTGAGAFPANEATFGLQRIDGFEGGLFSIQELSFVRPPLVGADIEPLPGFTQLKKTYNGIAETVLFECNIGPIGNQGTKRITSEIITQ